MILLRNFEFGKEYFDLNSGQFIIQDYDSEMAGWYKLIKGIISGLVQNSDISFAPAALTSRLS